MDASCKVQGNIHLCCLVNKYVSRILGTYHFGCFLLIRYYFAFKFHFHIVQKPQKPKPLGLISELIF